MSLWKIAWRSIQQRSLASTLTAISMALGVMLVVAVMVVGHVVENYFKTGAGLGYNLVVGKKGSSLQLVMNTVYYLDRPIENIPWSYYQEFLPAAARKDGAAGKFAAWIDKAVPVNLGDYYRGFRVIGTTPEMFGGLELTPGQKFEFSAGENFAGDDYFSGVIGSDVAKETGLGVGDTFQPTHGVPTEGDDHVHEEEFRITGILGRTGTPIDRALYVNIEGFFLIPDHAREADLAHPGLGDAAVKDDHDHDHDKQAADDHQHQHQEGQKDDPEQGTHDKDHKHDATHDHDDAQEQPKSGDSKEQHDHAADHDHEHEPAKKQAAATTNEPQVHDHPEKSETAKEGSSAAEHDHDPGDGHDHDHDDPKQGGAHNHEHDHDHAHGHDHAHHSAE